MPIIIRMPKLSDTMEEGNIASWLKQEGDFVEEGEPLTEIETDKATMEYSSPEEGYLLKIIVTAGKNAKLQEPIAVLGKKDEAFDKSQLITPSRDTTNKTSVESSKSSPSSKKTATEISSTVTEDVPTGSNQQRIKSSPLARKMATASHLDLQQIKGSGPNGRIIKKDIIAASETSSDSLQNSSKIVVSMMRKTIAKKLVQSSTSIPHFYLTTTINMDASLNWKKRLNSSLSVTSGQNPKISINDLVVFACAHALKRHRELNVSWCDDHIKQHQHISIAIAVALPNGLITPVVTNTDQLSLFQLAKSIRKLVVKAKDGTLQQKEYSSGTFSVSNLGMSSVDEFTAIINPPQAAILAVGRIKKDLILTEKNAVTTTNNMKVTLSCDHRVIDGMLGAKFLQTLTLLLEDPLAILV